MRLPKHYKSCNRDAKTVFGKGGFSGIMRAIVFAGNGFLRELIGEVAAIVRLSRGCKNNSGGVAERLKAPVLKTGEDESPS